MKVLGIETSCDETAVSVISAQGDVKDFSLSVLSNVLLSQMSKHKEYGGVYPSLAKREHAKNLVPIAERALQEAGLLAPLSTAQISKETLDEINTVLEREPELFARLTLLLAQYEKPDIDAIAVTTGPGLAPALWVGVNFARALSLAWNIPIVPVNHLEGHIIISMLDGDTIAQTNYPALALLISGGHTEMVLMKEWLAYEKIGQTKDDAVGEAFDKVARLLDLPYPGGPEISRLAREAREQKLESNFSLPRPMLTSDNSDFSFSGLKTAVLRLVEEIDELDNTYKKTIAREFEDAVADVFVHKVRAALAEHNAQTLILGGGVSANTYIKERLTHMLADEFPHTKLLVSPPERATDNALMIALAGYFHALREEYTPQEELVATGTKHFRKQSSLSPNPT